MIDSLATFANGTMIFISGCTINILQFGLAMLRLVPGIKPYAHDAILGLVRVHIMQILHLLSLDRVKFYIDENDMEHYGKEPCIVLANHRHHADFLYVMAPAEALGHGSNCRVFLKNVLKYVPVIGPINYFTGSLFLKRSLEQDAPAVKHFAENMIEEASSTSPSARNFLFLMFVEGTRITEKKLAQSNQLAVNKFHLDPLKNLLLPKPAGYFMLQREIKSAPIPTYLLTMLVKDKNGAISTHGPSMGALASGHHDGMTLHCQLKRLGSVYNQITDVDGTVSKSKCAELLNREWQKVDKDIDHMKEHGVFPLPHCPGFSSEASKRRAKIVYWSSMTYTAGVIGFLSTKLTLPMWAGILGGCAVLAKVTSRMSDPKHSSNKTFESAKKK